jgi:hypothetical protein
LSEPDVAFIVVVALLQEAHDESKTPRLDRLSPVGTAARVLQLSWLVQVCSLNWPATNQRIAAVTMRRAWLAEVSSL